MKAIVKLVMFLAFIPPAWAGDSYVWCQLERNGEIQTEKRVFVDLEHVEPVTFKFQAAGTGRDVAITFSYRRCREDDFFRYDVTETFQFNEARQKYIYYSDNRHYRMVTVYSRSAAPRESEKIVCWLTD